MSFFNGSAIAVMLKPMFPQVFERVEQMEGDGTLAKIQSDIALIANSDTLPAIAELARGLKEHNALLREIAERMKADVQLVQAEAPAIQYAGSLPTGTGSHGSGDVLRAEVNTILGVEPGSDTGATGLVGIDGA